RRTARASSSRRPPPPSSPSTCSTRRPAPTASGSRSARRADPHRAGADAPPLGAGAPPNSAHREGICVRIAGVRPGGRQPVPCDLGEVAMGGRERPRRPAMLDPEDADQLWGDSDPALASEAAHSTANAVIFGPSHHAEDEPQAERISRIIDAEGLDEIARLWSRSPAVTLPGALWRLYLLRAWLERDPETITMRFREGTAATAPAATREPGADEPADREALAAPQ